MEIREVSILSEDAQALIARLDQELQAEYAPEHRHPVDFEPFLQSGGIFVIAYETDTPVGCGALRPISKADVELKRMFVPHAHRGRGVARLVLAFLEQRARQLGFQRLLLETGDQQVAAMGLYRSSGYQRIEAFGEYVHSSRSVCFAKEL